MDLIDRQELLDDLNRFAPEHFHALSVYCTDFRGVEDSCEKWEGKNDTN